MAIVLVVVAFCSSIYIPVFLHHHKWLLERAKKSAAVTDLIYIPLIVATVCALTALSQTPLMITEAGRASLIERGLFWFVIAFGIGMKGYMIPLTTFLFLRRIYRFLFDRSDRSMNEAADALPALADALNNAGAAIAAKTKN